MVLYLNMTIGFVNFGLTIPRQYLIFFMNNFFLYPELSVLGLLGDDGPNNNIQGNSLHEAHVAFSVEGKVSYC